MLLFKIEDTAVGQSIPNRPMPSVEQSKGYYNVPYSDVYGRKKPTDEQKKEFFFSAGEDVAPLRMDEVNALMKRLYATAESFSPPFDPIEESSSKVTFWLQSGRSLSFAFYDWKQITPENCALIQSVLREEFPSWRVGIVASDENKIPIIYPTGIAYPANWRGREDEFWRMLREGEADNFFNGRNGFDWMAQKVVAAELQKTYSNLGQVPDDLPKAIMMFRWQSLVPGSSSDSVDVWMVTDNPPIMGRCHMPRDGFPGYEGAGPELGWHRDNRLLEHHFTGDQANDSDYLMRVYQMSIRADKFDRSRVMVRDPVRNVVHPLSIPDDMPVLEKDELRKRFQELQSQK